MDAGRRLPGWVATTGWVVLGVSALGLPVALVVAFLDAVRRTDSVVSQRVVLGALVVLAVVLVVAAERGLAYAAKELSVATAVGAAAGVVALVLLGVVLPGLGLVLVALGVVLGVPAALVGVGFLVWWRWREGPRPTPRTAPHIEEVRAVAEARRAIVRRRHDTTREAVARGYIGPGFTRGE